MNLNRSTPSRVTFVLTGIAPSGGVRVTLALAEALHIRGVRTRVLCQTPTLKARLRSVVFGERSKWPTWLREGVGDVQFADIRSDPRLWIEREIVVAVGSFSVDLLSKRTDVESQINYCHGFADHLPDLTNTVWQGDTPTIAVSPALIDRLSRLGARNLIGVVPNGIDLDVYAPQCPFDIRSRFAIGTVYSSHPIKRPGLIVDSLRRLSKQIPDAKLVAFGAEPLPRMDVPVHYVSNIGAAEAAGLYRSCRVWFVASSNEGFCLPMVEAMACGTPVVCGDFPVARWMLGRGEYGRLFNANSQDQLVPAVADLYHDTRALISYSERGMSRAREFSWETAADAFLGLIGC